MNELRSDNLWATIKRLAKKSSAKRAAVAYVTSEKFVKFDEGDVLITDAGDHAIATGLTNAKVLARAFKRGAQLYSLPGLHTKVLLVGGTAVIGSANLSEASAKTLVEAAWLTDEPAAVGMATSLVQQLTAQAEAINETFLKRILKIKVKVRPKLVGRSAKPKKVRIPKHRTWLLGVEELLRDYPEEQEAIESGNRAAEDKIAKSSSEVSWIRWTTNGRFRGEAKEGDSVIQIWSNRRAKNPSVVYRHSPIVYRQEEPSCTRFFVEEFADQEDTGMTWRDFEKLAHRGGVTGKIGSSSARPIAEACAKALFALWGE
jgi:hypothetical protein